MPKSDDEKTWVELFTEKTGDEGARRTLLLNAVGDWEARRLVCQRVSPFVDDSALRPVRFRIFGLVGGAPLDMGCGFSDIPGENEESLAVLDRTIASLPKGVPTDPETINAVHASGIGTVVMWAIFRNGLGQWGRYFYHHPLLSKEQAIGVASNLAFSSGPSA